GVGTEVDAVARWAQGGAEYRVVVIDDYRPGERAIDRMLLRDDVFSIVLCSGSLPPRVGAHLDVVARVVTIGRAEPQQLAALESLAPGEAAELVELVDVPDPHRNAGLAELLVRDPAGGAGDLRTPLGSDRRSEERRVGK